MAKSQPETETETVDVATETLRRIFYRDGQEVEAKPEGIGYTHTVKVPGCLGPDTRTAAKRAGFEMENIHHHIDKSGDEPTSYLHVQFTDTRGEGDR